MLTLWALSSAGKLASSIVASLLLILQLIITSVSPFRDPPIRFGETRAENNFPESMVFRTTARSESQQIQRAWFLFGIRDQFSEPSRERVTIEIEPGAVVSLAYTWETLDLDLVPWQPIVYVWEVETTTGEIFRSEEQEILYADTRYDWDILQNDNVLVYWHDQPQTLGQSTFDIAMRSYEQQASIFDTQILHPIRIILYNDFNEFAEYHGRVSDSIGGQAYTTFGITAQIIPPGDYQEPWLQRVIPHEISHLYFRQLTNNQAGLVPPAWINEGLAVFNQFGGKSTYLELARNAASQNDLTPLTALTGSFGPYNEERFRLAYAESYSAIIFLIEAFGEEALAELLGAYRQGYNTDEAFTYALDTSFGDFESRWRVWLGMSTPFAPTPTSLVWPTAGPPPTRSDPSRAATAHPGIQEQSEPDPTDSGSEKPLEETNPVRIPCLSGVLPLLALGFILPVSLSINRTRE